MRKPTLCICGTKGADQLRSNSEADQRLCFATRTVPSPLFLNQSIPASNHLLCLNSTVYVGPVRKPHCWIFHVAIQIVMTKWQRDTDNGRELCVKRVKERKS